MDALDARLFDIGPDLRRGILLHPVGDQVVAQAFVQGQLFDPLPVHLQDPGKGAGHALNVCPGLLQLPGVYVHMLHRFRSGEDVHVPVVDHAPGRRRDRRPGLVAQRQGGIDVVGRHHQPEQTHHNRQKCRRTQHRHHESDPALLPGICPDAAVA